MTELDDYLAAAAAYRKLCREGALATWLINNGFATSMLTAQVLAFALTDTRGDATENTGRCDDLEKQIIECIYSPFKIGVSNGQALDS